MVHDQLVHHHKHLRAAHSEAVTSSGDSSPSTTEKMKSFIDKLVYVASAMTIIMTFPQIWLIWVQKSVAGLSLISHISYFAGTLIWFLYGVVHKAKPIIVTNGIWLILYVFIIGGILLYG